MQYLPINFHFLSNIERYITEICFIIDIINDGWFFQSNESNLLSNIFELVLHTIAGKHSSIDKAI